MSVLFDLNSKARAQHPLASALFFSHNQLIINCFVGLKDMQERVITTIFENMRGVRTEHVKASLLQDKIHFYQSQDLKKIFEVKCL